MRILTDKQLREMQAECYNQGLIDANDKLYNQGFKDGMKAQTKVILEELNELQRNTWDQDRIKRIKEMIDD